MVPGAQVAFTQHPPLQMMESPSHEVEHVCDVVLHACPVWQSALLAQPPPDELVALVDALLPPLPLALLAAELLAPPEPASGT